MSDVSSIIKPNIVYLDNNATTACASGVVAAMLPYWRDTFGNESSAHYAGRQAHRAVDSARDVAANVLGVKPYEIFFNSGATEGNNWIFQALALSGLRGSRIVVSHVEHKSVLSAAKAMERLGFEVVVLPVTQDGIVLLDAAKNAITPNTALVSVQLANNETGVIQPVYELAELAHQAGAFFHCDAVQGIGKIPVDLASLGVDSAVISGHKIHGPKGVGVLFLAGGTSKFPWALPLHGGGQEHDIRPGTMNISGVVGIGKAFELLAGESACESMRDLQTFLERELIRQIPGCSIHGSNTKRIPNTTNVTIPRLPSDILMANLPLFCVSNGSACDSGSVAPSSVLRAMGIADDAIRRSIRISSSVETTQDEIERFLAEIKTIWKGCLC